MAQLTVPIDAARFAKGLSWKDYMAQMGDTQARTEDNYGKTKLTDEERKFFGGSALGKVKYAVMLAENWCGDVHRNSPLLAHICEAMPNCELARLLPRSEPGHHRPLSQQRLPLHSRHRLLRRQLERDRPLDRQALRRGHPEDDRPACEDRGRGRPPTSSDAALAGVPEAVPGPARRAQ